MSIDETSFECGQNYVTVVGAPKGKRVIGGEEGREAVVGEHFSESFEKRKGDCSKIRSVSMEISRTYKAGVDLCFPNAMIVYDHFHV